MKLCRNGLHDLDDPAVARIFPDGGRRCNLCLAIYERAYRAERYAVPEYAERERTRSRDKVRRMRADPAYQRWAKKRRQAFNALKEGVGCARCLDAAWSAAALTFHHIDPKTKHYDVSGNRALWKDSLRKEIAKCIVLCGGCHMEMHALLRRDARSYWREAHALEQGQRAIIDERIARFVEAV